MTTKHDNETGEVETLKNQIEKLKDEVKVLEVVIQRQAITLADALECDARQEQEQIKKCAWVQAERIVALEERNGLIALLAAIFPHRIENTSDERGYAMKWIIVQLPTGEVGWSYYGDLETRCGWYNRDTERLEGAAAWIAKRLKAGKDGPTG